MYYLTGLQKWFMSCLIVHFYCQLAGFIQFENEFFIELDDEKYKYYYLVIEIVSTESVLSLFLILIITNFYRQLASCKSQLSIVFILLTFFC